MCAQCRAPSAREDWFAAGAPDSLAGRRRARSDLARAATTLLGGHGLRVEAPPGAMALHLRTPTGRGALVHRLDEVVEAAHRLTGRSVDPLDPRLLDEAGGATGR
ncbi:hypothetical protein SAMN05216207_103435 [Pseudonocardia ammonioxydans]|uniref:Uncharacterized protein n=1 Tax=Pseudonocardia ammonioxydans TaxID=260086 RepID=A0A1I5F0V1_PSUAM|nr:hypothetical protein [Pseudonocardia ammonioxydans]SFO17418.1 hypothetical protein SAMN05216207_103435 [Pseudonocardia ammonioxydans]